MKPDRRKHERGFTIVEVVVAVLVLTVGLLGLASTAAVVTRMIAQGDRYTEASTLANRQLEVLRSQGCSSLADGSTTVGRFQVSWRVTSVSGGRGRQVTITVVSPTGRGSRTDTFSNTILC